MTDVDRLAKKFAKYEPMLEALHKSWDDAGRPVRRGRTEDPDMPTFGQKVVGAGAETISPELHAQIHAPLNASPEAVEARRQQALENEKLEAQAPAAGDDADLDADGDGHVSQDEIMRARFVELGPDQVRTLLANGGLPAAWNGPATLWLAEKDKGAGLQSADASATGQNQGAGSTGGSGTADGASTASKALPEPSLTEQPPQTGLDRVDEVAEGAEPVPAAQADGQVATDQGSTAKAV